MASTAKVQVNETQRYQNWVNTGHMAKCSKLRWYHYAKLGVEIVQGCMCVVAERTAGARAVLNASEPLAVRLHLAQSNAPTIPELPFSMDKRLLQILSLAETRGRMVYHWSTRDLARFSTISWNTYLPVLDDLMEHNLRACFSVSNVVARLCVKASDYMQKIGDNVRTTEDSSGDDFTESDPESDASFGDLEDSE